MTKKSNVNPDHYKVAGRERHGENVRATEEKRELKGNQAKLPQKKK